MQTQQTCTEQPGFKLKLTNTLTASTDLFTPLASPRVMMYVCGITPYDFAHLGHGRCYVNFDFLFRLLSFLGYDVRYCRNFTDIDDKLIARAQRDYQDPSKFSDIASRFIEAYHSDMAQLNCKSPHFEPRVTNHIPQIITFIQGLVQKGYAYEVEGDVYFSIKADKDYGKLARKNLDDLIEGVRIEVSAKKKYPLDFALWKATGEDGIGWDSPWGLGRPGWHIECSALAGEYLGRTIDIHAGGMDLIFPHHENEIAQSESLYDQTFSRFWLHNAFIMIDSEKMSKSLGNVVNLRQLFTHYDPMVIRYYFLAHHYRNPLDFVKEDVDGTQKSYHRLCRMFQNVDAAQVTPQQAASVPLARQMIDALCDDLNVAQFLGIIFGNWQAVKESREVASVVKFLLQETLGLTLEPLAEARVEMTPEIRRLLEERQAARKARDWQRADELRDKLLSLGVRLQDEKIQE